MMHQQQLVVCKGCGGPIGLHAVSCPRCGTPGALASYRKRNLIGFALFLALNVVVGVVWLLSQS